VEDIEDAENRGEEGIVEHEVDNVIDEGTLLVDLVLEEEVVDEEVDEGSVAVHADWEVGEDTLEVVGVTLPSLHLDIGVDVTGQHDIHTHNDTGHDQVEHCPQPGHSLELTLSQLIHVSLKGLHAQNDHKTHQQQNAGHHHCLSLHPPFLFLVKPYVLPDQVIRFICSFYFQL